LVSGVTEGMEAYDMAEATRPFDLFVDDLSTWYLRRSRDRVKEGEAEAKQTLYTVLKTVATVLAPFAPFTAEDMWLRLKNESDVESVHLSNWPTEIGTSSEEVLTAMKITRDICAAGHMLRQKSNLIVRQPLATLFAPEIPAETYQEIIKDELNVKNISKGDVLAFDTVLTPELKLEGNYRELVRAVQDLRKKEGFTPSDKIAASLSQEAEGLVIPFMEEFKKTVQAESVSFEQTEGSEVIIDESKILVKVVKI